MNNIQKPSSTKIEQRSLNALESIIDKHKTMLYDFSKGDKEMSWDGFIWLFKFDNGNNSKNNAYSRVPVQIKGHDDTAEKFIHKEKITYPVDIADLNLYATEKGVLYFQIFLKGESSEVFYCSLYPSKIAGYLEEAVKRGNKESISISFNKLGKDPFRLYRLAKQFNDIAMKEGSVYTDTVQNRIRDIDFTNLKEISFSFIEGQGIFDVLQGFSTGDICLFGKINDNDKSFYPLEWKEDAVYTLGKDIKQTISINDIVYYDSYTVTADSNRNLILTFSPNLSMNITTRNFHFQIKTSLEDTDNDANFILALLQSNCFYIGNQKTIIKDQHISKDFEKKLNFIVALYKVAISIGICDKIHFNTLSEAEYNSLASLVNTSLGKHNDYFPDEYNRYDWKIGEKYYPLLVIRNNELIKIISSIYSEDYGIFIYDLTQKEPEPKYRMPTFTYHSPETLSKLFFYNFDSFKKQIQTCDVCEEIKDDLNDRVLPLISTYDICGDKRFLELAELLLARMIEFGETPLMLFNKMQISKRYVSLSKSDINRLEQLNSEDYHILFGKYVLLDDYANAEYYFSMFTNEEKEMYKQYPIFYLFEKLNHNEEH